MKKLWVLVVFALTLCCMGCEQQQAGPNNTPEATDFGYIVGCTESDGQYEIAFDEAEWLTAEKDADRLSELGKDADTLENGYFINNPDEEAVDLPLSENVKITVLSFTDWSPLDVDKAGFVAYYDENLQDVRIPFWLTVEDGVVTEIAMQYVP